MRGSVGVFYDRLQGDSIFGQIGNPPTGQGSTVVNSTLQSVAAGHRGAAAAARSCSSMTTTRRSARRCRGTAACRWCCPGRRRSTCRMSARTTTTRSRSAPSRCRPATMPMDLNAPDIGTAYLPQYQDPTRAGEHDSRRASRSRPTCCVRIAASARSSRRGRGSTRSTTRCRRRSTAGSATAGRAASTGRSACGIKGNTLSPQHLQHNADGTIGLRPEQDAVDEVLSNAGLRRHLIKGNFVWDLPDMSSGTSAAVEGARGGRQRLAAVGRLHRRLRRAVRRDLLVSDQRREREPDRLAELPRAHPNASATSDRAARAISTRSSTRPRSRGRRTTASATNRAPTC